MNLFPLWTASVWPTNSGEIVERRAQVLSTRRSFTLFSPSSFFKSFTSTNGPFLTERLIALSLPWPLALLLPTADDVLVGELALAGLLALRQQPPRRARMPPPRGFAFAAAHRMI